MRQVATAYTGANISITIGGKFIANAFGISWELSQNKRPIYGYNSMYYDSVASGQIIVMGQIYINYQHPNYLSSLLKSYFSEAVPTDLRTDGFGQTLSRNSSAGSFNTYLNRGGSARQDRNFNEELDDIFNNPALMANLGSIFTSGQSISGFKNYKEIVDRTQKDSKGKVITEKSNIGVFELSDNSASSLAFAGNLSSADRRKENIQHLRPDQFTNNGSANVDSIDIVVTHGDPGLNDKSSGILSYTPASSIILRGIHFIGEAQQVMADDQPIMETYKFIARSKESLISVQVPPPEPVPETTKAEVSESQQRSIADTDAAREKAEQERIRPSTGAPTAAEKEALANAAELLEINRLRALKGLPPLGTKPPE